MHASAPSKREDPIGHLSTDASLQPSSSFFHTVAALLGITPSPCVRPPMMRYGDPRPPETSTELLARRYPYFYFHSMSG